MSDIAWSLVLGMFAMIIIVFTLHTCCDNSVSNAALNNPKYKIDTMMTVTNSDTVYTYKFTRK